MIVRLADRDMALRARGPGNGALIEQPRWCLRFMFGRRGEHTSGRAACGDGGSVVLASDRMFTVPAPINLEFETSEERSNRSSVSLRQFLYCGIAMVVRTSRMAAAVE